MKLPSPQFESFFMAGFECSYSLTEKERWDLLRDSKHEQYCREDYQLIKQMGIHTVREGLAWHQIDRGGGQYNFSRFEPLMQIAQEEGVQQIWDFTHYSYPEYLDPFSKSFVNAFAEYAVRSFQCIRRYQSGVIYITLINEISYWSWIGADLGIWAPFTKGVENGIRFKLQLIAATMAAMDAIWAIDPSVRFIQVDPFMYREALLPASDAALKAAREFNDIARFQTWDILSGKSFPELGGAERYLDIVGINYYVDNQQWLKTSQDRKHISFQRVPIDSPKRQSLANMLEVVHKRYGRPMILAETGSYGEYRTSWWRRLLPELDECSAKNIPLFGVCIYPTLDNPDEGHFLAPHSGLWDFAPRDRKQIRHPHAGSIALISEYIRTHRGG